MKAYAPLLLIVLFGCPSGAPDDDDAPTPAQDLPDGPPADIELADAVTCADPVRTNTFLPYEDVTEEAGIGFDAGTFDWPPSDDSYNTLDLEMTGGFAVADLDLDGHLDLLFTDGPFAPRVFLGDGALGFVAADPSAMGIPTGHFLGGVSAADADGDGDADLLLLAREENVYLQNDGGVFTDRSAELGFQVGVLRSASASWADFDRDGDLDIFIANHGAGSGEAFSEYDADRDTLLRQGDDGAFTDIVDDLLPLAEDGHGFIGGWFDADGDGWLDLYIVNDLANGANDKPGNTFVRNGGAGDSASWSFELVPDTGLDVEMLGMGLAIGDMDGDGDFDLHASNVGATFLARNEGDLLFTDVSLSVSDLSERPIGDISWATAFFDHDADGSLELYTAYGQLVSRFDSEDGGPEGSTNAVEQQDTLWSWDSDLDRYVDDAPWVGINDPSRTRSALSVDLDGDGFEELITTALYRGPRLWRSGCNDAAWAKVRLVDEGSSNREAIGARVEAWVDGRAVAVRQVEVGSTGVFSSGPAEVHFGLGSVDEVGFVVRWPDGEVTVNGQVPVRREVVLRR